tara:strand:- start:5925 stop:6929 length:1005 start_codon:yes stop_codon:yes gene_type:complete
MPEGGVHSIRVPRLQRSYLSLVNKPKPVIKYVSIIPEQTKSSDRMSDIDNSLADLMRFSANLGPKLRKRQEKSQDVPKKSQDIPKQSKSVKKKEPTQKKEPTKLEKTIVKTANAIKKKKVQEKKVKKDTKKKEDVNDILIKELIKGKSHEENIKVYKMIVDFLSSLIISKYDKDQYDQEEKSFENIIEYHNQNLKKIVEFIKEIESLNLMNYISFEVLEKIKNGNMKINYLVCDGEKFEKDNYNLIILHNKLKILLKQFESSNKKDVITQIIDGKLFDINNNYEQNLLKLLDLPVSDDAKKIAKQMNNIMTRKICTKIRLLIDNQLEELKQKIQ